MRAGSASCHCDECGVVCPGRFEACPLVWAQGPQPITLEPAPSSILTPAVHTRHQTNGNGLHDPDGPTVVTGASAGGDELPAPDGPDAGEGSPAATGAGREAVRGLQNAFDALRLEVHGLRDVLAQDQAETTSLVEKHFEDAKLDTDNLRTLVDVAVREAMLRETADLKAELAAAVTDLGRDLEAVSGAQESHVAALQSSITALATESAGMQASVAAVEADAAGLRTYLGAIAADVAGSQASLVALAASSAEVATELNRREATTRKAFRATLREELQPLVDVVAESVAQSDYELRALGRRLDQLAESEASVSAGMAEVTASVAALAADMAGADAEPEAPTAGDRRDWADVRAAPTAAAQAAAGSPVRAAARRPLPGRPSVPAPKRGGTRVSLRDHF